MARTAALDQLERSRSPNADLLTPESPEYEPQAKDVQPTMCQQAGSPGPVRDRLRRGGYGPVCARTRSHSLDSSGRNITCRFSSNDDDVLLDLSKLQSITVDPVGMRVRVGAGVLLEKAYQAVQGSGLGLMLVGGECKPVGVAGITLGGGFGLLSRSLGLSWRQPPWGHDGNAIGDGPHAERRGIPVC